MSSLSWSFLAEKWGFSFYGRRAGVELIENRILWLGHPLREIHNTEWGKLSKKLNVKLKNFLLAAGIVRGWAWLLMAHAQRPNRTIHILISFDKAPFGPSSWPRAGFERHQDEAATLVITEDRGRKADDRI